MDPVVFIPLAVAIVGPLIAYIRLARMTRGKVATSDAAELWKESRDIRDDYKARLLAADQRHKDLEGRVQSLERINTELMAEKYEIQRKHEICEALRAKLEETIRIMEMTIHNQREELEARGR